jgi:hypothetical protein
LKNSLFVPISQNLGDRKCLGDPGKSIVGLPDAILFLSILREGVFQQPPPVAVEKLCRWGDLLGLVGLVEVLPGSSSFFV